MTPVQWQGLEPTRRVLANGARVIARRSRTSPAVTFNVALRAGSLYDPSERLGLAHFLSRVIDRGTENRTAEQIADELDNAGVTLNITITRHVLTVSCTCLAEDFERMLDLVGDVVMRPTFPDPEVETRRREIITSIRQDEDNPAVMAVETLFGLLYPGGHPYGRRAKGEVETVARIDRPNLQEFHRAHFGASSTTLVIVGDVEESGVIDAAARVFGGWTGSTPDGDSLSPVAPPASRRQVVVPMAGKAQSDIAYGFTTITRADPTYYDFWVMNNVLGQYALGGRLGDSIRERQGMAYYVFSAFDANVGEGPLVIRAGVSPANVERTIASIDEEVDRMAKEGATERELGESKQHLIGSVPRTLETNAGIATFLQTAEYFGLGLDYDLRLPDLIDKVTREGVHEVARRFLVPSRAAITVAGPSSDPAAP
jgi:zinc protease